MMLKLLAALILLILVSPADAERLTWKTDTRFWEELVQLDCDVDLAKADLCHHFVTSLYKSTYGLNIYLTYIDGGIRASVGFRPDEQSWRGEAEALNHGALDVGGIECGKSFKSLYVIKRFNVLDPETLLAIKDRTYLVIFRLKADGSSSLIGPENKLISDNQGARALAERDAMYVTCE
jgi:hypothetical protein